MTAEDNRIIAQAHQMIAYGPSFDQERRELAEFIARHYPLLDETIPLPNEEMTLSITGDAALIRQIGDAVELQGRLHLGQFDVAADEIEKGIWSGLHAAEQPQTMRGRRNARAAARWMETLLTLKDALRALGNPWWAAQVHDEGTDLRDARRERERRAYQVWKSIPWALAKATGQPLPDDYGVMPDRVTVRLLPTIGKGKRPNV